MRGEDHPPTAVGKAAMNLAAVAQVVSTCVAFFGDQIFAMAGLERTPLAQSLSVNKMQLLGFSFLFNSIAQSLAKTDAFEMYINGELFFSKLEKKRMPNIEEIMEALADRGVGTISKATISKSSAHRSRQM